MHPLLEGLIDPLLVRLRSRSTSCFVEKMKVLKCTELVRAARGRYDSIPEDCDGILEKVGACMCGKGGQAQSSQPFASSDVHRALQAAPFSPKTCEIRSAKRISLKELQNTRELGEAVCDSLVDGDELAQVYVACEGEAVPYSFHGVGGSWRLLAVDPKTLTTLSLAASEHGDDEEQKKEHDNLNKGLH